MFRNLFSSAAASRQFSSATVRSFNPPPPRRQITSMGERFQSDGVKLTKAQFIPCNVRYAASPIALSVTTSPLPHSR